MTHKEKDMLIKKLKEKIKDMEGTVKETVADVTDNFNAAAVSLEFEDDGTFSVVKIEYSKDSGRGKVISKKNYGKKFSVAVMNCRKILSDDIILKQRKEK